MTDYTCHHPALLTKRNSAYAPAALAAYALGATLWTPALVMAADVTVGIVSSMLPLPPVAGAAEMAAAMWLLRFLFYVLGARGNWNYGYGINGVIVNRRWSLAEKAARIGRDWFGVLLIGIWVTSAGSAAIAAF